MFKRMLHRQIARLERRFGYDGLYMHEILDASGKAFWKFGLFQIMSAHRESVPKDAWYAARIAAARHEDCGPCTQLVVDMALKDGVAKETVRGIVARDFARLPEEALLGLRFAEAVLAHDNADDLRGEIERRHGKKAVVSLAFAIASSRVYPAVKGAMGHAKACERIRVAGEIVEPSLARAA